MAGGGGDHTAPVSESEGAGPSTYDVAVVGAGVVGAAVARLLSHHRLRVALIEAGADVGAGTSKANTAILHTGFDSEGERGRPRIDDVLVRHQESGHGAGTEVRLEVVDRCRVNHRSAGVPVGGGLGRQGREPLGLLVVPGHEHRPDRLHRDADC